MTIIACTTEATARELFTKLFDLDLSPTLEVKGDWIDDNGDVAFLTEWREAMPDDTSFVIKVDGEPDRFEPDHSESNPNQFRIKLPDNLRR